MCDFGKRDDALLENDIDVLVSSRRQDSPRRSTEARRTHCAVRLSFSRPKSFSVAVTTWEVDEPTNFFRSLANHLDSFLFPVDYWALGVLIFEMNAGYSPFWVGTSISMVERSSNASRSQDADQQKNYHKIINAKFRPRSAFSDNLVDIVRGLLQKDLTKRLGMMFNGINDIKKHLWFRDIDWLHIFLKKVRAPWIPDIRVNNFPDAEDEEPARSSVNLYEKEFHDF